MAFSSISRDHWISLMHGKLVDGCDKKPTLNIKSNKSPNNFCLQANESPAIVDRMLYALIKLLQWTSNQMISLNKLDDGWFGEDQIKETVYDFMSKHLYVYANNKTLLANILMTTIIIIIFIAIIITLIFMIVFIW